VEELATGEISLYAKPRVDIVAGTYTPGLDVGSRNDKAIKKESLLLVKGSEVIDITKTGKKILPYFGEQSAKVEAYVKENDLSYRKKEDLTKIVQFFNENKAG
jgi:hypothetical protein